MGLRSLAGIITLTLGALFLDLAFVAILNASYERTLTKILFPFLSRVFGGPLTMITLYAFLLYILWGLGFGLLGIVIVRYLSEEIGALIAAASAGYVLYLAATHDRNLEFLLVSLAIFLFASVLSLKAQGFRGGIRFLAGILEVVAFITFQFYLKQNVLYTFIAFVYLFLIASLIPAMLRIARNLERGTRKLLRKPNVVFYSLLLYVLSLLALASGVYALIESRVVASLYGTYLPVLIGLVLFIFSLVSSSVAMAASDVIVVAGVIDPKKIPEAASIARIYGLVFGPKRIAIVLKVFLIVLGTLILLAAEEKREREAREAGAYVALYGLSSISQSDLLYLLGFYLVALYLLFDDDVRLYAARNYLLRHAPELILYAFGTAIYVVLMSLVVSAIAAGTLYRLLMTFFLIKRNLRLFIGLTAMLFVVIYSVLSPTTTAAMTNMLLEIVRRHEREIEEEARKIDRKSVPKRPKEFDRKSFRAYLESLAAVRSCFFLRPKR